MIITIIIIIMYEASWPACATMRLVEVLYLLCKDSPERVRKYLIHYKADTAIYCFVAE